LEAEKIRFIRSFFYPFIFLLILWLIKSIELIFSLNFSEYGLYPLQAKGLPGILTAPFLHADLSHLFANSIPLLILGALLFYFYRDIAWPVLLLLYLITGIWVWTFARGGAAHIGASGIIYGLASFLFFSGIIRRETRLMVITLLVTFLYGGLIWGIFPQFFPVQRISWESHLMGLLAGLVLAIYFRKKGPQRKIYEWDDDEGNDNETNDPDEYSEIDTEVRKHPPVE
jgi:membrane associated rhomboid family serine protease